MAWWASIASQLLEQKQLRGFDRNSYDTLSIGKYLRSEHATQRTTVTSLYSGQENFIGMNILYKVFNR